MILSIDPGLRKVAVAIWTDDKIFDRVVVVEHKNNGLRNGAQWVAMARATRTVLALATQPSAVVYEHMQIYDDADTNARRRATGLPLVKGKADNLLQLAGVTGALLAPWPNAKITGVRPRQWKTSGTRKAVTERQARATLSTKECEALDMCLLNIPGGYHNDAYDAVGIGLFYLRR